MEINRGIICNIVPDFAALLNFNHISELCCFQVKIETYEKNDVWKQHRDIFGIYEIESGAVNGKPHYSSMLHSGKFGIWHNKDNKLIVGLTHQGHRGAIGGFAYNDNRDNHNCPYGPAFDWFYVNATGYWKEACDGLTISCLN